MTLPCVFNGNISHKYEDGCKKTWEVFATVVELNDTTMEVIIEGRGSEFYVIIGEYGYGQFLCIPSCKLGCSLPGTGETRFDGLRDYHWIFDIIADHMNETDALTIAKGLSLIGENFKEHE